MTEVPVPCHLLGYKDSANQEKNKIKVQFYFLFRGAAYLRDFGLKGMKKMKKVVHKL